MHISIDTSQEISYIDKQVLALLGGAFFEATPAPEEKPAPKAAPKPSGAAKKAAAPKAAPKAPEPVEEPESEPEEDATEDVDRSPKGAYDLAAKMLSEGKQGEVKAALTAAGVKKVSLLDEDNVEAFFEALGV